jgi:hypothetical protein
MSTGEIMLLWEALPRTAKALSDFEAIPCFELKSFLKSVTLRQILEHANTLQKNKIPCLQPMTLS